MIKRGEARMKPRMKQRHATILDAYRFALAATAMSVTVACSLYKSSDRESFDANGKAGAPTPIQSPTPTPIPFMAAKSVSDCEAWLPVARIAEFLEVTSVVPSVNAGSQCAWNLTTGAVRTLACSSSVRSIDRSLSNSLNWFIESVHEPVRARIERVSNDSESTETISCAVTFTNRDSFQHEQETIFAKLRSLVESLPSQSGER
jgi:hypothetical protein